MSAAFSRFVICLFLASTVLPPVVAMAQETVPKDVYDRLTAAHRSYFNSREKGDYEAAYAQFTEGQKNSISFEKFSTLWAGARKKFGRLTQVKNTKVTWYRIQEATPDAPAGLYAAVDFRGSFERLPVYCGYIVWSIDGGYKIKREEMTFMQDSPNRPMSQAEKDEAFKALSCR